MGREGFWPVRRVIEATDRARKELAGVPPESLTGKCKRQKSEKIEKPILPTSSVDSGTREIEAPTRQITENFDTNLGKTMQGGEERVSSRRAFLNESGSDMFTRDYGRKGSQRNFGRKPRNKK